MIPILTTLAANGLALVANAVMSVGKETVEKKLGISLDSPEQRIEIIREAAKQQELWLNDVANARNMSVELSKSANWLNSSIVPILALIVVLGGAFILANSTDIDTRMACSNAIVIVIGFYFGSSKK